MKRKLVTSDIFQWKDENHESNKKNSHHISPTSKRVIWQKDFPYEPYGSCETSCGHHDESFTQKDFDNFGYIPKFQMSISQILNVQSIYLQLGSLEMFPG